MHLLVLRVEPIELDRRLAQVAQGRGDRATLTLTGVSGPALRAWLSEARSAAHARAIDVQLLRNAQGYAGSVVVTFGAGS